MPKYLIRKLYNKGNKKEALKNFQERRINRLYITKDQGSEKALDRSETNLTAN